MVSNLLPFNDSNIPFPVDTLKQLHLKVLGINCSIDECRECCYILFAISGLAVWSKCLT